MWDAKAVGVLPCLEVTEEHGTSMGYVWHAVLHCNTSQHFVVSLKQVMLLSRHNPMRMHSKHEVPSRLPNGYCEI